MHFGASMFFTDYSMPPAALAKALEARGFESVWAAEHSHIPLSRRTHHSPAAANCPSNTTKRWTRSLSITAAAMATTTLNIGTGVCLMNQRDPIPRPLKLVASIDQVSGGRFLFRDWQWLESGQEMERSRHRVRHPPQIGARAHRGR